MCVLWSGPFRFVDDLVGRMYHACRCTVCAGLPAEIGQLKQLTLLDLSWNRLKGKYVHV